MRQIVKLGFMFAVFTSSLNSYGQTSKGNFIISGSTGLQFESSNVKLTYDGETQNEFDTKTFSFIPSVGYFIVDNLAIGLSSNITFNNTEFENSYSKNTSIMIAPTVMYFFPIDGKIRPFALLGIGYQSITNKQKYSLNSDFLSNSIETKMTLNGFAVNFNGGVSYFVSKHSSIDLCLSYTKSTLKKSDDEKIKHKEGTFSSNIGISVFF